MKDNPLHASFYADQAREERVVVLEQETLARDTYRIRIRSANLAARFCPGQFLMVRLPEANDPLLGRAFALYDVVLDTTGTPVAVDFVYSVVGKLTSRLTRLRVNDELSVWGPLGNGFRPLATDHLVMVAGGIGQTPFLALAKELLGRQAYGDGGRRAAVRDLVANEIANPRMSLAGRVTLCYGTRSAEYLAGIEQFQNAGIQVRISTDDGTCGHHGFVTDLLRQELEASPVGSCRVVCCGPERMMHAVSELTEQFDVPCEVSLETPMACGIGLCFSCVAKVCDADGEWDYKRTCVEGPVFDARRIIWD